MDNTSNSKEINHSTLKTNVDIRETLGLHQLSALRTSSWNYIPFDSVTWMHKKSRATSISEQTQKESRERKTIQVNIQKDIFTKLSLIWFSTSECLTSIRGKKRQSEHERTSQHLQNSHTYKRLHSTIHAKSLPVFINMNEVSHNSCEVGIITILHMSK